MNRNTWNALHHSIRADARAFKAKHGGFPCFAGRFTHNGTEWTILRSLDRGATWATRIHASRIVRQPLAKQVHLDFNEAMQAHVILRGPFICNTWGLKRQIRACIHGAREWRLNGYPTRMVDYPAAGA